MTCRRWSRSRRATASSSSRLLEDSRKFESVPIRTRLSDEEVARFSVQRYRFPGVEVEARLFRQYPLGDVASHVIGYIGRINARDAELIEQSEDSANYAGSNHIGKEGVEKSYEKYLHGTTGYEEVEVSASGRAVRSLSRTPATPGHNLILSIDIELQKVVEEAFGERRGALVAIEPATGDILAYVSRPGFDPNLFVDGIDQQSWDELNNSPDKPLVNRPLSGAYPPGSTYKPFMALAALELGKRTPQDAIADPGYFWLGNHKFRDDKEGGHGMVDMYKSIVQSCDTYYYLLANDMGVDTIHDFMKPFGFGQLTGIDLEHERAGLLPSTAWKKAAYKKPEQKKWFAGETISLGIGQGYNAFTPLQLAHATAILANNGVVMKPHLVKAVEDPDSRQRTLTVPKESYRIPLQQKNIDIIKQAMVGVTLEGTSRRVFANAGYESAGKTGTAQVIAIKKNEKYDASKIDAAAPRPRAVHRVRAGRAAAHRACHHRRERRLRRRKRRRRSCAPRSTISCLAKSRERRKPRRRRRRWRRPLPPLPAPTFTRIDVPILAQRSYAARPLPLPESVMALKDRRTFWEIAKPYFTVFDGPLALIVFLLLSVALVTLYSAGIDVPGRVEDQLRNILIAFVVMWIAANVPPQTLMRFARAGLYLRRGAADRGGDVRAGQEGRAPLARPRHRSCSRPKS